jgi:arylsulfatase A-like enzyme
MRLLLLAAAFASGGVSPLLAAVRPNILFIFADDQSTKTVSCYPEAWPWVQTPNIDALAQSGVRFRGGYFGGWCMPSRAAFLTGKHPHGIESLRMAGEYPGSTYDPELCPFWPATFRKHGYHTAQIGKWHTGTDAGFGRDWDYQAVWNRPKHPDNAGAYYTRQRIAINGVEQWVDGYPADNYTQWAYDYIRGANRDPNKPWYLWLCYGNIHGPYKPADRHKGRYKDQPVPEPVDILPPRPGKPAYLDDMQAWRRDRSGKLFAGRTNAKFGDEEAGKGVEYADWVRQVNECMPSVDEGVGRLMQALRETGQLDNTLVIYTADQGFAMGEHGMRNKVAPYDAAYLSPLIVSMPGKVAAGKVSEQSPTAPDLVATFHAFAGITPPAGHHGYDLTPLLRDPDSAWPHPCMFEHTGHDYGSDVAKVLAQTPEEAIYQKVPWYTAVVHEGWKYIHYLQPGVGPEVYDLRTDPHELTNLATAPEHASRIQQLRSVLAAELRRTQAPTQMIPTP